MIDAGWHVPVPPMTINVVLDPLAPLAAPLVLGEAVGAAIKSNPEGLRVAVIGTGGLSDQSTGPDFGKVFAEWAREFLGLLDRAPSSLAADTMADFARRRRVFDRESCTGWRCERRCPNAAGRNSTTTIRSV